MAFLTKTGSFDAATATGNQAVSGVGFQPKALLIWGVGGTTDGTFTTAIFGQGIGFSTSPSNQYAQSSAANATSSTSTSRRVEACAFLQANTTLTTIIRRANLASMDSDGFTLNWTTARVDGSFDVLHYLALGGDDLTGARVVNWQMATATGNKAVTGAGFQPDAVLHVHAGGVTALTGDATQVAALGLGAMTANGDQWATGYITTSTSAHTRNQESDKTLTVVGTTGTVTGQASYTSMDSDGFTVNFGVATAGAYQVISLCLAGGQYKIGQFAKSTAGAPVSQAVTGTGFTPTGLMLAGVQDIVRASPLAGSGVAYGLGASDGSTEWGSALWGSTNASRKALSKTTKAYVKVNTTGSTVDAEADLTSLDSNGFTLNWTTNDAVATSLLYLAMGSDAAPVALDAALSGSSALTAAGLQTTYPLTGSLAGSASIAASRIQIAQPMSAATAGDGSLAASRIIATHPLAASLAGSGAASASRLILSQPLASALTGAGSLTAASIRLTSPLTASLAGSSILAAQRVAAAQPLTGSVTGTGSLTASRLALSHALAADVAGAGALTASRIDMAGALTAMLSGSGAIAGGRLILEHPIAADIAGIGAIAASLGGEILLTANLAGSGSVAASRLGIAHPLLATLAGAGSMAGQDLRVAHPLTAGVVGNGAITASTVLVVSDLAAALSGSSSITATRLNIAVSLDASLFGAAMIVAQLDVGQAPITSAIVVIAHDQGRAYGAPDRAVAYAATDPAITYDGSYR